MDKLITLELWISQADWEDVAFAGATLSTVIARSPCDEAIQSASAEGTGLLRCARNDGECGGAARSA
ncbi:hypothetical protein RN69_13020 [Bradyrhizobium japonicum]|nr:hypothetical protein RN69_13020 [Bradyrhizobium japonicum]